MSVVITRHSELDQMVEGLTCVLALHDSKTEEYTRHIMAMTVRLAHAGQISHAELLHIHCGAMLHDIKIGIPLNGGIGHEPNQDSERASYPSG